MQETRAAREARKPAVSGAGQLLAARKEARVKSDLFWLAASSQPLPYFFTIFSSGAVRDTGSEPEA
jgi:hypothetical protein